MHGPAGGTMHIRSMHLNPGAAIRGSVKDDDAGIDDAGIWIALERSVRKAFIRKKEEGLFTVREEARAVTEW